MRSLIPVLIILLLLSCQSNQTVERSTQTLLLYSTPEMWEGQSVQDLASKLTAVSEQTGISVDTASRPGMLLDDSLAKYSAVAILDVPGQEFGIRQHSGLERYVQSGGGLILSNPSVSSKYYWPWYNEILSRVENQSFEHDGGRIAILSNEDPSDALNFAIGENRYYPHQARTVRAPDQKRFVKQVLDNEVNEPIELAVLPGGNVLFLERRGLVKLYDAQLRETRVIDKFDVRLTGNYEDGMLGLALDPLYHLNNWIYIYYSRPNSGIQSLSRFVLLGGDSIIRSSEKVVMEVPVQIETCCHSGGSIVFGPDGNLWLSTGDNTSSKESDGYSPLDERPGRGPFDAQKGSSNTHDLRGKILRIKPTPDGGYTIPDGNLFPKDGSRGRPEIYVMGLRNPYRFTVDPKTKFLYWGEVGPDSGSDSRYGPRSYDEYNQAREPGFFGWPYFQGDSKPFPDRDFVTDEVGAFFDPLNPVNNSPYNYGDTLLPPTQDAMIWYPYNESAEFPMLGTGSRSALGGPFYYSNFYPDNSRVKFPSYYDGKWFIYEWVRSWIKVVSFDQESNMMKIEPFLPEIEFFKPIDMEFGPEGSMYILEYGANYFANNDDATLSKIEYGAYNLLPFPVIKADKAVGAAPLTVAFSAKESFDYDPDDELTFEWLFTEDDEVKATGSTTNFTFNEPGLYSARVRVTDSKGESSEAAIPIKVGNEPPNIDLKFDGNRTFYYDNSIVDYQVEVTDSEDGTLADSGIDQSDVLVSFSYMPQGKDLANLSPEQLAVAATTKYLGGKNLIAGSDCKSCHSMDKQSIGPTYLQIVGRYAETPNVVSTLASKIIQGGSGEWGHSLMAAHPQHTQEEAEEMVNYILSLTSQDAEGGMALSGQVATNAHIGQGDEGSYLFFASYQDRGGDQIGPLTTRESIILRNPKIEAEEYEGQQNFTKQRPQGGNFAFAYPTSETGFIIFHDIDLTGISHLTFRYSAKRKDARIRLHRGSAQGELISEVTVKESDWTELKSAVLPTEGMHDLYFEVEGGVALDWIRFER